MPESVSLQLTIPPELGERAVVLELLRAGVERIEDTRQPRNGDEPERVCSGDEPYLLSPGKLRQPASSHDALCGHVSQALPRLASRRC